MKIYNESITSTNAIVTHAIGGTYLSDWERYSLPTWLEYTKRHDLGLFVIDEIIKNDNKKLYWQKLLIGNHFEETKYKNICYLDTDIIINPAAPNIFDGYDENKIAIISQKKNLPYDIDEILRRLAFFRHNYLSKEYPLDSSLFMSIEDVYLYHNLEPQNDIACTGVFVFNIEKHSQLMEEWFYDYDENVISIDGGGEEVFLNYKILSNQLEQWLNYKWQALWIYEMPWCHSHLYVNNRHTPDNILPCIETSLFNNYFLHFAGAWEGSSWKICDELFTGIEKNKYFDFKEYMKVKLKAEPVGIIRGKK